MKFVSALIGAYLGWSIGDIFGALAGLVLGPALWTLFGKAALGADEPARPAPPATGAAAGPAPLEARVQALEQEVARLRSRLQRLEQAEPAMPEASAPVAPPAVPDTAADADTPRPAPAEPRPVVLPPAVVQAATPVVLAKAALPASPEPQADAWQPALPEVVVASSAALDGPAVEPGAQLPPQPVDALGAPAPEPAPPRATKPPAPPPVPLRDRLPPVVSRLIFGGNTIVKAGVLILFLGLAFLLRYAAERVTVPLELRYAGVGAVGAFLLGLGWRLRERADKAGGQGYGLILQGAGIGVFYLTALAALKLHAGHPLLSAGMAFGFMAGVAVLGAVLAVKQDAPWLALVSIAEGFAAPVLISDGSGNHIALFSYLAILDIGIFLVAWHKAWRPLHLVGLFGTLTLASGWAHSRYTDALYPSTQAFLLLFFLLFTAMGVLFARRALAGDTGSPAGRDADRPLSARASQALAQVGRVDSTLVFGVPLATFGLQYTLVEALPWGPAWAAFGYSLFYLLLGGGLLRGGHPRYGLLGEAYVIVSVIFGTLAIPLALEGAWTGATWAVEAAGMYWLGARQHRPYARAFGLLVLLGGLVRLASSLSLDLTPGTPLIDGSVLGVVLFGASALAIYRVWLRIPAQHSPAWESANVLALPWLVTAPLALLGWMLLPPPWASVTTAWLALACAASRERLGISVLGACSAVLHVLALAGLVSTLHVAGDGAMLASGWQGLAAAVLIAAALLLQTGLGLRRQLRVMDAAAAVPAWSLPGSLGLLAGLAVLAGSLLFVMPADRAALLWPVLGLAALFLALRLAHPALALAGLGLQLAAGVALLLFGAPLWGDGPGVTLWGPLILTAAGLLAGDWLHRRWRRPSAWRNTPALHWAVVLWSLAWWAQVLPPEGWRQLLARDALQFGAAALAAWVLLTSVGMAALAGWRRWQVLGRATAGTLPAWVGCALVGPAVAGLAPSAHLGWAVWPLALAWHLLLLRRQTAWWRPQQLGLLHVLGFWLFLLLAARECQLAMAGLGEPGSAWPTLGWMLVPALLLGALTRPALLQRWPLTEQRDTYLLAACAPLALYLVGWLWVGNLQPGNAAPLPYVPLLNPLELGQGLVLLALLLWQRALPAHWQQRLPRRPLLGGLGATAFALYTFAVLRACHHWAGVVWSGDALYDSTLTQAALSVAWSVLGVLLMLAGHRQVRRGVWVLGAALLGVVVLKLFLVELADRGSLYRIVSFIVVGVLLLVVGYFAPVPPRRRSEEVPA